MDLSLTKVYDMSQVCMCVGRSKLSIVKTMQSLFKSLEYVVEFSLYVYCCFLVFMNSESRKTGRGADLHMAQLMLLPLTVSCSFLVPTHPGSSKQRVIERVCVYHIYVFV